MVPGWFLMVLHSYEWVFMVFHGSRLVFHGPRAVFMVFHSYGWVITVFHGSRLVFTVPGRFSWFFINIPALTVSWPNDPV